LAHVSHGVRAHARNGKILECTRTKIKDRSTTSSLRARALASQIRETSRIDRTSEVFASSIGDNVGLRNNNRGFEHHVGGGESIVKLIAAQKFLGTICNHLSFCGSSLNRDL